MKVKEFFSRCTDALLIEELAKRGYHVFGDDDEDAAIDYLSARGITVDKNLPPIEDGWMLWRTNNPRLNEWLYDFFWRSIGRMP